MKYLVTANKEQSTLAQMDSADLKKTRFAVSGALGKGSVKAAYAFVGGGFLWIVDVGGHAALARGLRKLGIFDAEVTPLVEMAGLIAEYEKYQASKSKRDRQSKPKKKA